MVSFEFMLSEDDFDRLYELKKNAGRDDLNGNQYARILLEKVLHELHPQKVVYKE